MEGYEPQRLDILVILKMNYALVELIVLYYSATNAEKHICLSRNKFAFFILYFLSMGIVEEEGIPGILND